MSIKQEIFEDDNQPPVSANWLNSVVNEINNSIKPFTPLLLDGNNTQLLEILLKITLGKLVCKLDPSSTSTQYNLIFNEPSMINLPKDLNYFEGMTIWLNNTITNTGSAKINLLNKGSKNILKQDGSSLQSGDLKVGLIVLMFDENLDSFKKCNIV